MTVLLNSFLGGLSFVVFPASGGTKIFTSVNGVDFTQSAASGSSYALRPSGSMVTETPEGYSILAGTASIASDAKTYETSDFSTFTLNTSTSTVTLQYPLLWWDASNARLVLAGQDTSATTQYVAYTSTDGGVTWTPYGTLFTQSGGFGTGLSYKQEIGVNYAVFSYRVGSTSTYIVKYINKTTLSVGNVYSGANALSAGSIRYLKGIGSGGADYGRFINMSYGSYGWYVDESSSGLGSITYFTPPSAGIAAFDVCYVGGKYVALCDDTTGNNYLKMYYSSDLVTWSACTQPTITGSASSSSFGGTSYGYTLPNNGIILYNDAKTTGSIYGILTSTDGITWAAATLPSGWERYDILGVVL